MPSNPTFRRLTLMTALGFALATGVGGCYRLGLEDTRNMPDDNKTMLGPKRPPVKNMDGAAEQGTPAELPPPVAGGVKEPQLDGQQYAGQNDTFWSSQQGWSNSPPATAGSGPLPVPSSGDFHTSGRRPVNQNVAMLAAPVMPVEMATTAPQIAPVASEPLPPVAEAQPFEMAALESSPAQAQPLQEVSASMNAESGSAPIPAAEPSVSAEPVPPVAMPEAATPLPWDGASQNDPQQMAAATAPGDEAYPSLKDTPPTPSYRDSAEITQELNNMQATQSQAEQERQQLMNTNEDGMVAPVEPMPAPVQAPIVEGNATGDVMPQLAEEGYIAPMQESRKAINAPVNAEPAMQPVNPVIEPEVVMAPPPAPAAPEAIEPIQLTPPPMDTGYTPVQVSEAQPMTPLTIEAAPMVASVDEPDAGAFEPIALTPPRFETGQTAFLPQSRYSNYRNRGVN
jgi:hypothetical protein